MWWKSTKIQYLKEFCFKYFKKKIKSWVIALDFTAKLQREQEKNQNKFNFSILLLLFYLIN